VVDNIHSHSVIYSFGVGEDISFDLELINQYEVIIHAFDPTPRSIEWVRKQNPPSNFILHEYGLANFDGHATFLPPANPLHVSHSILDFRKQHHDRTDITSMPVKKMHTIMTELNQSKVDILKMDIEGAEYQVIDDLISSGLLPTQLLVEFHHRFPSIGIKKTNDAIVKLRKVGYKIFSVSPSHEEFGFILMKS
jgi:FkbM family methyltransferase